MKKLLTVVFTMLLAGSLAFAQGTAGTPATGSETKGGTPPKTASGKKAAKTKAHKGGKKGKKSTTPTTTTTPK
jgi:hypothetical protein